MKVLVTGATGFIGAPLCRRLAERGNEVIALSRNGTRGIALQHPRITPVKMDITSKSDLNSAIRQCETCFHLAAIARPWARAPDQFKQTNVDATRALFELALQVRLRRVVFTSTASVFGPAPETNPISETSPLATEIDSDYERSKLACEEFVGGFQADGLDVVTVYPTRVYGPGPMTRNNAVTRIIKKFNDGYWRFIPGDGTAVGNYVFIDDVVEGHVQAMFGSPPNERYLLGGDNVSFNQIVECLHLQTGKRQRLFHVPASVLLAFARLQVIKTRLFGTPPVITPPFVRKYLKDWNVDVSKAKSKLGINAIPFADGLAKTLAWIGSRDAPFS